MPRTIDFEFVNNRVRLRNSELLGRDAPVIEVAANLAYLICEYPEQSLNLISLAGITGLCFYLVRGPKKRRA